MLAIGLAACARGDAKEASGDAKNTSGDASDASEVSGKPDAAPRDRLLSANTRVNATLQDSITSRSSVVGDTRRATVSANVTDAKGHIVIPAGSTVTLTIVQLEAGSDHKNPEGKLLLVVTSVTLSGRILAVDADLEAVPYHMAGRGVTSAEAERVGAGTAIGAIAGQIIGKNTRSTVIGGAVGAVAGTAVAVHYAVRDVVVSPGTPIVFTLTQALNVSAK